MAITNLTPTKIQYTLSVSDYSNWDSGTLGRPLVGIVNVEWHGSRECRAATRLTYVWPSGATNCTNFVIYIPFKSQSSPGRCAAYLTTKDLGIRNVVSSSWIGPSNDLKTDYIAKAAHPYLDEDCKTEAKDGVWYGSGSNHPNQKGVYFEFKFDQALTPGVTYYVYIIQDYGTTDNHCSLYGSSEVTSTDGPIVQLPNKHTPYLYKNGKWKKLVPYRWTNGKWELVDSYIS